MTTRDAAPSGSLQQVADWSWALLRRIHLGTRKPSNWIQLFQFGLVGASGYAVNLGVFAGLALGFGMYHVAAAVLAFCVAVSNNFLLNRLWTFREPAGGGAARFQATRFFVVSVGGLIVNLAVLTGLVDGAGVAELPSQAAAVAVAMPVNFIGNKLWTFSQPASAVAEGGDRPGASPAPATQPPRRSASSSWTGPRAGP